jgi:uracil-DNA glycosylase
MRGTTSLLRLLLGIHLGSDYESEFYTVNKSHRCHLFDAFSLENYLLCSAVEKEDSTTDKSTKEMKANCREHFLNSLKILEPTVVVLQGKGFRRSITSSLDSILPWDDEGVLFDAEIKSHSFTLALFSHPSARNYHTDNWGADDHTPYLLNVVMPTTKILYSDHSYVTDLFGINKC